VDYTRDTTRIVIPAGNLTGSVAVTGVDDLLDEANETVIVDVSTVINGTETGTQQVSIFLLDNDATPSVDFAAASQSVLENAGVVSLTVQLSAASGMNVTVPFSVNGTSSAAALSDYTIASSPVVIPAGSTSVTINVTVVDDVDLEPDETVVIDLLTPTNGVLGATATHTLTITANDGG
jgi:hypothetical protein